MSIHGKLSPRGLGICAAGSCEESAGATVAKLAKSCKQLVHCIDMFCLHNSLSLSTLIYDIGNML